jgi:hypothetical protein
MRIIILPVKILTSLFAAAWIRVLVRLELELQNSKVSIRIQCQWQSSVLAQTLIYEYCHLSRG